MPFFFTCVLPLYFRELFDFLGTEIPTLFFPPSAPIPASFTVPALAFALVPSFPTPHTSHFLAGSRPCSLYFRTSTSSSRVHFRVCLLLFHPVYTLL
ncbi:hypothetical protein M407DRAFT_244714 [Tulasnella calospora MUT 4182]|uniref:Uncharacterized protein n=1 Tax=Tulasnella calospora MUT 4182 TaxID=1051891 RepID=A0A0C3QEU2_9AGAM|nr:hypothetical protein M407DRAFT_244714 [Tulasnella calospora MUT 4182]